MAEGYLCSRSGDRAPPFTSAYPVWSHPGTADHAESIRWERRSVGYTAHRCRRTRPRSPILSTTAASHVPCSVSCAAGGLVPHAPSNCRSRAPSRVLHSADGHWLACELAPDGATRSQIWVVTTDPDDRDARRIDNWPAQEGPAELI